MAKTSLLLLALAAAACERASAFLAPLPLGTNSRSAAAPAGLVRLEAAAFTTVSGRILEDPKGELQKVLTPSPKDEARRARVGKLLEQVGLSYTGEALFPSNRYYGIAAFRDLCEGVGVEPADQVGAAALIVAAGDKGYKPFHKKVGTFLDILHALVKTVLAEKDEFEGGDLAKVFVGLTKLGYEGSPKQLVRDLLRELTARMEAGELSAAQTAAVMDAGASYWFVPEDAFFAGAAKVLQGELSDQDKARVKDAAARYTARLPHLKAEGVLPAALF